MAKKRAATGAPGPGPLVGADWLAEHLDDADLRVVHVSTDRRVFNKRHLPGATYCDLHREIALRGRAPETGDAEREGLLADPAQTGAALRRWRVGEGDRIVLYDDVGLNRHGYTEDQQARIKEAYKILFRSKLGLNEAITRLKAEYGGHGEIDYLLHFIEASKRGITR